MSQRVNRAFYSEPLISFPGRLHITAEKSYIEVLMKEDGKRTFRTFPTEDYNALIELLTEQDFYQEGFELAYEKELLKVSKKARRIREFLFKDAPKPAQEAYQRKTAAVPKQDSKVKGQVAVTIDNHKIKEGEAKDETKDAKVLLGNLIGGVASFVKSKKASENSADLSSRDIELPAQPLFEQPEDEGDVELEIAGENVSAMASKYIDKFANLHLPKKNGRYAIDKAVLLMCVISLYDGANKHQGPTIHCNSELKELFESKWEKYGRNAMHDDVRKTFLTLSEESFWHLNPPGSNGEFSALIDSGLAATLTQQKSRSLLRKTLYSRYLK